MKMFLLFVVLTVITAFYTCRKKPADTIPLPKAAAAVAAPAVPVSSAPVIDQNPLTAPGTYLKTTVGHVKEAKAAKALYEAAEKKNLDSLNLNDTGGN